MAVPVSKTYAEWAVSTFILAVQRTTGTTESFFASLNFKDQQ